MGRDRSTVANTLRLLRLPREVRELVAEGALDAGHARALLALDARRGPARRSAARPRARASRCARSSGAWRCCARRGRRARRRAQGPEHRARPRSGCARALGTRVEIRRRGKGGAIRVLFTSEAELQRLFELAASARARGAIAC